MKIAFVIHTAKDARTAVYASCLQRATHLAAGGHHVEIVGPEDFRGLARRRWLDRARPLIYPFAVARWLSRRGGAFDVVIFHSYAGWVFNLLRTRGATGEPHTITAFHGLEPLYYRALAEERARVNRPLSWRFRLVHGFLVPRAIRLSCRLSDRVFCLNTSEAVYLTSRRWASSSVISVVSNGVSREMFLDRRQGGPARRLLFVGQWLEAKGIRYLVDAFTALARERPDLGLCCAGTLAGAGEVAACFPEDVRERVSVRPRLDAAGVQQVYQEADIFVFPTLSEGFSTALLEAMAAGLPIVTTPVGAAADLLRPERDALVVPVADAKATTAAVRRLIDDRALRERLGREARVVASSYELTRVCDRFLSLLIELRESRDPATCARPVRLEPHPPSVRPKPDATTIDGHTIRGGAGP